MSEVIERELGWDDEIEKESEFILLPEGDYDFEVISFERGRHNGSDKLPPCNKAIIRLKIETEQGSAIITHNLFLHTRTESMLSAFFAGIGQKKKGEKITMNWNTVTGETGKAFISIREYDGKKYNEVKKIYPKAEKAFVAGQF